MKKVLHLGSGGMVIEGAFNTDLDELPGVDMALDASKVPYPFDSDTWDEIYNAHMIEHIEHELVPGMIKEWYRILKPGGEVIVEAPDIEAIVSQYAGHQITSDQFLEWVLGNNEREGQHHRWGWCFETLKPLFEDAGFRKVEQLESQDYHTIHVGIPGFRLVAQK